MANEEHLAILRQGVAIWNEWRRRNSDDVRPDLSGANLSGLDLFQADLFQAQLVAADLSGATLWKADLSEADLSRANLSGADLTWADLSRADLSRADLSEADLSQTDLVGTDFSHAILSGCDIYGISVWDIKLDGAIQKDLVITELGKPIITVDDIEVAQFIHLLIHNEKLRKIIDTITGKAVLILGSFTQERKVMLDAIREEVRKRDYIPILFDFEKPDSRDLSETIVTLAHMARFIIADLTDAKSLPLELQAIVPNLLSVAVQPIILREQRPFAMFEHIQRYQSVLSIYEYDTQEQVIAELVDKIIVPAEEKVKELRPKPLA